MNRELFSEVHIGLALQQTSDALYKRLVRMGESSLDLEAERMISGSQLTALSLDWDGLVALGHREKRSSSYSNMYDDEEETLEVVYSFELPYEGSRRLFSLQPSNSKRLALRAEVKDNSIVFEIIGADKARLDQIKEFLNQNVAALNSELHSYNEAIAASVKRAVQDRKEQLKKNDEGLAAFGVPLKEK